MWRSPSTSGSLPTGVTLIGNPDGTATLTGTPAAGTGGSYTFTITASNGVSPDATQNFTLTVDQAPAITSAEQRDLHRGLGRARSPSLRPGSQSAALSESRRVCPGRHLRRWRQWHGDACRDARPRQRRRLPLHHRGFQRRRRRRHAKLHAHRPASSDHRHAPVPRRSPSARWEHSPPRRPAFPTATLTETGTLPAGVAFTDNGDGTATLTGTPAAGDRRRLCHHHPRDQWRRHGCFAKLHANRRSGTGHHQRVPRRRSPSARAARLAVTATGFPAPTFSAATTLPTGVTLDPTTGVANGR